MASRRGTDRRCHLGRLCRALRWRRPRPALPGHGDECAREQDRGQRPRAEPGPTTQPVGPNDRRESQGGECHHLHQGHLVRVDPARLHLRVVSQRRSDRRRNLPDVHGQGDRRRSRSEMSR